MGGVTLLEPGMSIVVLGGAGYVGLVASVAFARVGCHVTCVDLSEKIAAIRQQLDREHELHLYEPGLMEAIVEIRDRLTFTDDYAQAMSGTGFVFVAVATPNAESPSDQDDLTERTPFDDVHGYNLNFVSAALEAAVEAGLCERHAIVMKSTVPAGTGSLMQDHVAQLRRARGAEDGVVWLACPEFLREGSALRDFFEQDRVVIGDSGTEWGDRLVRLMSQFGDVERMDVKSAEMVKHASNGFLATKITFANEVANLSDLIGVRVDDLVERLGHYSDIQTKFLRAGLGFGGSCFPKDVAALMTLAENYDESPAMLRAVLDVNAQQPTRALAKLEEKLGSLAGKTIALLGLAFKPNTSDMREAVSLRLIEALVEAGARVQAYDPHVVQRGDPDEPEHFEWPEVSIVGSFEECVQRAHGAILVTEWEDFRRLDWTDARERMAGPAVVDGRGGLDHQAVTQSRLDYDGIGRRILGDRAMAPLPLEEMDQLVVEVADAYRAVKAAFGEEIASICRKCGADAARVATAIGRDSRIGSHHLSGRGPDRFMSGVEALQARAHEVGYSLALLDAITPTHA
jgi:UDPglucose 6-dehydrogenase